MQLNSTIVPVRAMDQQHPPTPPTPPPETATVHRYATPASTRQGLNAPELIRLTSPPLPMRLSEARLLENQSNGSPGLFGGRRDRTGLRSTQSRSNPNDYVDEPVFTVHDRSDGQPVPSSSPPSALTSNSESKTLSSSKDKAERTVSSDEPCKESIFCPRCQRCRCIKCQQSRRLPTLRCGQTMVQCLPEDLVNCCSCLWCARAAYRRCSDDFSYDDDLESTSEALCACTGRSCCRRWTVLAALTPCLPCLCLYWPLRWLLSACSACHNCRRRGCHCDDARRAYGGDGQGGALLISDELLSSNSSSSA